MRKLLWLVVFSGSLARCGDDNGPVAAAQRLFDAMQAHDGAAASALFLPGATLGSVDAAGKASVIPFEKFVARIASSKSNWLEQIWDPQVMQHGAIAVVWASYNFHRDGKLSHCGVDSFQLIKTASGWKISAISDTRETAGCSERKN
jgi:hypothetical protein